MTTVGGKYTDDITRTSPEVAVRTEQARRCHRDVVPCDHHWQAVTTPSHHAARSARHTSLPTFAAIARSSPITSAVPNDEAASESGRLFPRYEPAGTCGARCLKFTNPGQRPQLGSGIIRPFPASAGCTLSETTLFTPHQHSVISQQCTSRNMPNGFKMR